MVVKMPAAYKGRHVTSILSQTRNPEKMYFHKHLEKEVPRAAVGVELFLRCSSKRNYFTKDLRKRLAHSKGRARYIWLSDRRIWSNSAMVHCHCHLD